MSKKYRVGRKQRRVVLDENGIVVVEFPFGMEKDAKEYCEWRNMGVSLDNKINYDEELLKQASELLQRIDKVQALSGKLLSIEMSLNRTLTEEEIKSLQLPKSPLKPLSELHKDEEACRRVAALLFGEPLSRNIGVNRWGGGTTFWYMGHSIDIEDDGEFGYEVTDSSSGKTVNIFALVDLIRELGYGPEKKEI